MAHGRRLKHFCNSKFEVTEDLLHHLDYQKGELLVIDRFSDIRKRYGQVECLLKWKVFGEEENDWLAEQLLPEDVPDLFQEYLVDVSKNGTARQRKVANRLLSSNCAHSSR